MQPAIKIALLAAGLAAGPSAAAIVSATTLNSASKPQAIDILFSSGRNVSVPVAEAGGSESDAPIELTQAIGPPWAPYGGVPVPLGPPPGPRLPGPFGFAPPAGPPPSPRVACEEEFDRLMGLAGYLKSKMRLRDDQKTAWQKVEQAAAPGAEKIRSLCAQLPSQPMPEPNLFEHLDIAEMQMAARLELLRAVHEPLQALYETLSSDQRALLAAGPRLLPLRPPPPPQFRP